MFRTADADKIHAYAVEDELAVVLDNGGPYDFYGSTLDVHADKKFQNTSEVKFYVNIWAGQMGMMVPPRVRRSRRGNRAAYRGLTHTISLPPEAWSMRSLVVIHELAHAAVHKLIDEPERQRCYVYGYPPEDVPAHGVEWQQIYVDAVRSLISREAALILQSGFCEMSG